MKKRGKYLLILVFTIILFSFIQFGFADLFTVITQGDFNNGTYSNTEYNVSGFVQLSAGNLTGNYTSKVFDGAENTTWNNLTWIEGVPYGEDLPANEAVETVLGGANMTGNILLMHLNETSGQFIDSSGHSNTGNIIGEVHYNQPGKLGQGVMFNRTTATAIQMTGTTDFDVGDTLSVEFWFKRRNTGNFGDASTSEVFVREGTTSFVLGIIWHVIGIANNQHIRFGIKTGTGKTIDTASTFNDTNWHHIAAVYNSSDMLLYVDGVFENSTTHTGNLAASTNNITIGTITNQFAPNATMDEVAIYNRSLTAAEILNHYKRGALKLNLSVQSCDDSVCSGESFTSVDDATPQQLSIASNRYFQYKFDFETDNISYTPELYNVTLDYKSVFPNMTSMDLMGKVSNTSITINLINGHENSSTYVEYGSTSGAAGSYTDTTTVQNVTNDTLIEFDITGLTTNTVYYYRVRSKRLDESTYATTDERSFRTRRASYPFNFTLISDMHVDPTWPETSADLKKILANMSLNDNSDFVMSLGDNIQPGVGDGAINNETWATSEYVLLRESLHPDYNSIPFLMAIGNWEGEPGWIDSTNLSLARSIRQKFVPNPTNTTYVQGGGDYEDYYAFTWGNALFIVLNVMSYTPVNPSDNSMENWTLGSTQLTWFNNTLKNATEPWKFVIIHHTAGGNWTGAAAAAWTKYGRGGGRAAYSGEQATIQQMMVDNDVRIMFLGHDHLFTDMIENKTHYIVVGNAGYGLAFTAGYGSYYNDSKGRAKVEVLSDEITKVYYITEEELSSANVTIDRMPPRINIVSPSNDSGDTDGNITFIFNVTDASTIENCTFFFNNAINQSNTSMVKDLNTNFTINNLAAGNYAWFINCTDYNFNTNYVVNYTFHGGNYTPNMNTTGLRTFSVITNSEFSGNTTDLSQVNVSNISNLIMEVPSLGMINFTTNVDLSNGTNLDNNVNISQNRIEVNSTALPELNTTATLTLYNLTFTNPRVLKDGAVCSDCTEVSYTNNNFIFNVTSFSIYTAGETPTATAGTSTSGSGVQGGETPPPESEEGPNSFLVDYDYLEIREIELELGDTIKFIWDEITLEIIIENTEERKVDINEDGYSDVLITFSETEGIITAKLEKIEPRLSPELREGIQLNKNLKTFGLIGLVILIGIIALGTFFAIKSIGHGHYHKKKK